MGAKISYIVDSLSMHHSFQVAYRAFSKRSMDPADFLPVTRAGFKIGDGFGAMDVLGHPEEIPNQVYLDSCAIFAETKSVRKTIWRMCWPAFRAWTESNWKEYIKAGLHMRQIVLPKKLLRGWEGPRGALKKSDFCST